MKTKIGLFCLCVITAMLLSACEIGISTKVNADGSGEMGAVMKFEKAEADALSSMGLGGTSDTLCASMSQSGSTGLSTDNMQFTQETHGDQIWCVASQPFTSLAEMGNLQRDRRRPMDQMVDLDPELLAHLGIEAGGHLDRRLTVVRGVEDALPGKLGRNPFDIDRAFGFDGLLVHVHVERAAAHLGVADQVGGDGIVEARRAFELDLLELEV